MSKSFMLAAACVWLVAGTMSKVCAQERGMTLQQIFDVADQQSQRIRVSETGIQSASEGVRAAKSARLPDVNLSLSGSYIGTASLLSRGFSNHGTTTIPYAIGAGDVSNGPQPTPHWGNNFAVEASQVLYAGGAISAGIRMAELGEQMANLDVVSNRQEVRFLLTGYYLNLYQLQNQIDVIQKNLELTEQVLDNMRARRDQGTVLKNDITRYELQLQNLQLTRVQLEDARSIMNHQLVTTLHMDDACVIVPDSAALEVTLSSLDREMSQQSWQREATQNNVGLQQAELATQIAQEQVTLAKADKRPQIALVAQENLWGPYTSDLIPVDANVNAWFVGVGIKYNLGSLWRKNHAIRKAQLDAQQSSERYALAQEGVENGVQANYVNLLTSYTEVQTQEKQVELANQNYDVVRNRYDNELALLTDMLDASSMKLSADMALVNARLNLLYNFYKLKYVTSTL